MPTMWKETGKIMCAAGDGSHAQATWKCVILQMIERSLWLQCVVSTAAAVRAGAASLADSGVTVIKAVQESGRHRRTNTLFKLLAASWEAAVWKCFNYSAREAWSVTGHSSCQLFTHHTTNKQEKNFFFVWELQSFWSVLKYQDKMIEAGNPETELSHWASAGCCGRFESCKLLIGSHVSGTWFIQTRLRQAVESQIQDEDGEERRL